MAKRIPVKVNVTTRQMTADEEKRFMTAIDALIRELVEREVDRRVAKRQAKNTDAAPPNGNNPDFATGTL